MNKLIIRSVSSKKLGLNVGTTIIGSRLTHRQFHHSRFLSNDKKIDLKKDVIPPKDLKIEIVTENPVNPEAKNPPITPIADGVPLESVPVVEPVPVVEEVPLIPEPEPEQPKKKFSFTWFFIKYGFYASVLYGGLLYAATKSETVYDFVIDKQLPFYEEIIDFMEHGSIEDLNKKYEELANKVKGVSFKFPSKDDISEITEKGEKFLEDAKNKISPKTTQPPNVNVEKFGKNATPAQQLQKPVETVSKPAAHLPLIKVSSSSIDESVKSTINSFNDLIKSIDIGTQGSSSKDALIKVINDNVSKLTSKIESLTSKFDESLQLKLKDSQTDLLSSYTKKELELTQNLLDQFNTEKTHLEKKLNARLENEINATKEAISQAAVNAVSIMRIEQTKKFEKLVKERIDKERNGRLANLSQLNDRLKEIEEFSITLENQLSSNHSKTLLSKSITNLKHVLFANSDSAIDPKLMNQYLIKIDEVSKIIDDELVSTAVKDLKPLLTSPILSVKQLLNAWDQLTPELRSASLLPPNAGLLGHFASIVFSKLLLPVKGSRPEGKDIESVIGRIESNLSRGELDLAVEEAANLKGWPRKLADDWVKEGRKRLEVQFLIDILESESRIL